MDKWKTALNAEPVWRDGLTTKMTYLIFAVRKKAEEYTCVCVRAFGQDSFKVKLYPDTKSWNFSKEELQELGGKDFLDRTRESNAGYVRYFTNKEGLAQLIATLSGMRNTVVAPTDLVFEALATGSGRSNSKRLHPIEGGGKPSKPFAAERTYKYAA